MPTDHYALVRRRPILLALAFLLAAVTLFTALATGMAQAQTIMETLGDTQYTQDTTWPNDRSYVLAGSVVLQNRQTQFAAGYAHTCTVVINGGVQCWGYGINGQLGLGGNYVAYSPQAVIGLAGAAIQVVAGEGHTCALLEGGSVQCWGRGFFGQLGTGSNSDANTPQTVVGLASPAVQLAAGSNHNCALLESGDLQCWGRGFSGQLGTGSNGDANTPQTVVGLARPVTQLEAGGEHTCALLQDGSVQCWGWWAYGQLDTGDTSSANTPQAVIGLASAANQIAAGYSHTCALLENGSVQCWGHGKSGQLGAGSNSDANLPQNVVGLTGTVTQVAAGYLHTCALLEDGSVQCWGEGASGELGTGGNSSTNAPQNVVELAGAVTQLAAGGEHTCALLEAGGVQCWGEGASGQLGTGGNSSANTPQNVINPLDPPDPPRVLADVFGHSNLYASWWNTSPNVDQYRYAIGTSRGARDMVDWTYTTGTSFVRNDLNLAPGQYYYVTVQAHNTSGLWSADGVGSTMAFTPTPTFTPSATYDPSQPTWTPTPTKTATPTPTATYDPSQPTWTPTPTFTQIPTWPPTPTAIRTTTHTPAPTFTSTSTATPTPTPTGTWPATATPTATYDPAQPTWTPTPTFTSTSTATPTPAPTDTGTTTPTSTETSTPALTDTSTSTPTPTDTATPTPADTSTPTPTATGAVTPPPATETVIPPDTGGTFTGPVDDQQASLTVPPGAVSEPITLTMQAVTEPPAAGGFAVLGQGFRIEAQTLTGAPVTQFAEPLTLVVHYTDADVAGIDENTLQIFYWNETQAAWVAIPTTVDAEANTLTAQMDHLTLFAVLHPAAAQRGLHLPLISR